MPNYQPGEILLLSFPFADPSGAKRRPALVLIDTGDVIVHIFRPEIREFYNIEKMWAAPEIEDGTLH